MNEGPGKTSRAHSSDAASLCELTGILPEQESRARSRHPRTPVQVPRLSFSLSSGADMAEARGFWS